MTCRYDRPPPLFYGPDYNGAFIDEKCSHESARNIYGTRPLFMNLFRLTQLSQRISGKLPSTHQRPQSCEAEVRYFHPLCAEKEAVKAKSKATPADQLGRVSPRRSPISQLKNLRLQLMYCGVLTSH